MRLFEHEEFEQAVLQAARRFGLSEQFVEKDYYVTEILRIVTLTLDDRAVFKGGTSLSKGWDLIERFSEDIDLFVDPRRFTPPAGKNRMDRVLKELAEDVAEHPALTWLEQESTTIKGLGREDHFAYRTRFGQLPGLRSAVRLEPGVQSGDFPVQTVQLSSLVGRFLIEQDLTEIAEDLEGFPMTLLHYRRTFVEKLFALHSKVLRLQAEGHPLGRDARHYADVHALAADSQVRAMLRSEEYAEIRADYDRVSKAFYPRSHRPPPGLSFSQSVALFPPQSLRTQIAAEYAAQCALLFPGGKHPSFDDVLARLEEIRELL